MVVFENEFGKFEYIPEKELVIVSCFSTTENMSNQQYLDMSKELAKTYAQYKPKYVLIRHKDLKFIITTDIQDWLNKNVIPELVKAGTKKLAFIVPHELFVQVSVEQTVEEERQLPFERKFFEQEQDALKWLLG